MIISRRSFVGAAAAGLATPALSSISAPSRSPGFPPGFMWGAATSPYQVEGNNINSDLWVLEHVTPTLFPEPSGDAANSFELWPVDLNIVKGMGLNAYRFGLEWARIEPEPGQFSVAMLDHYKGMIDGCHARGLTPVVTFNHFTTPRWFAAAGGWANAHAPEMFARYCERAARHLADGIGFATTLNEPNLAGLLAAMLPAPVAEKLLGADRAMAEAAARQYGVESFYAGNGLWVRDPAQVQQHLLTGHVAGRQAIKAARTDLPVGVSLAIVDDQAIGPHSLRDATRETFYAPWLRAARADDFVGVQNYERARWTAKGKLPAPAGAVLNDSGAEVYPPSLAGAVRYAYSVARVPVIVTEHGVGTSDDTIRVNLIPAALAELKKAIDEGVPVKGYFHWSLIDNYEWVFGYGPKYGLHALDRATFKRTPKPSAAVYAAIARASAA